MHGLTTGHRRGQIGLNPAISEVFWTSFENPQEISNRTPARLSQISMTCGTKTVAEQEKADQHYLP
jgi:hypothetical protein